MKIKKYIVALAVLVIPNLMLNAQSASFLNIPGDTKELSMGGVNFMRDADIVLDDIKMENTLSYVKWSPKGVGNNYINEDFSFRIGKIGILAQARLNGYDSYPMYDGNHNSLGNYKPQEYMIGLGAAYSITKNLGLSVLAKYVGSNLAPEVKASAFCADVNILYRIKNLTIGLLGANLGSSLNYQVSKVAMPMLVKTGVQNDFCFNEKFMLTAGLDAGLLSQGENSSVTVSAGLDFKMFNMISIMGGYHFSSEQKFEPSYISAGLGIEIFNVSLDAAYLISESPIGNTFGVSVGYSF